MSGDSYQRWNPLAVLGRWRQLLWLTPLAALLTSLIWHFLDSRRESAVGVVDLGVSGGSTAFSVLVSSPELLAAAANEVSDRPEQVTELLASKVACHPIDGTSLVQIEVRQTPGIDAAKLCGAILRQSVAPSSGQAGAVMIREEAIWQVTPWAERLQSFKDRAGPVLWGSLCLALGLAYLAETLEPRRAGSGRSHLPIF